MTSVSERAGSLHIELHHGYDRSAACAPGDNTSMSMKSVVADPRGYDWERNLPLKRSYSRTIIASIFRDAPGEFLKMIVVHELAHLKEKEHNKAFYQLCEYMEPAYGQLEFDTRLFLTHVEMAGSPYLV